MVEEKEEKEKSEIAKWVTFRTLMRSIGTSSISFGTTLIATGNILLGVGAIVIGLIVLGIKDFIEESAG